jgi:hypothetical protein
VAVSQYETALLSGTYMPAQMPDVIRRYGTPLITEHDRAERPSDQTAGGTRAARRNG